MKLKFTRKYAFYVGASNTPVASFKENEEIILLRPTEDDPHNYAGKQHTVSGTTYKQPENIRNWWVEANNGVTVWTSIPALLLKGVLVPVT
jgi:hypothetical protein